MATPSQQLWLLLHDALYYAQVKGTVALRHQLEAFFDRAHTAVITLRNRHGVAQQYNLYQRLLYGAWGALERYLFRRQFWWRYQNLKGGPLPNISINHHDHITGPMTPEERAFVTGGPQTVTDPAFKAHIQRHYARDWQSYRRGRFLHYPPEKPKVTTIATPFPAPDPDPCTGDGACGAGDNDCRFSFCSNDGACLTEAGAEGQTCATSACTSKGTCTAGECTGEEATEGCCKSDDDCPPATMCGVSTCHEATGRCLTGGVPDGTPCNNGCPWSDETTCKEGLCAYVESCEAPTCNEKACPEVQCNTTFCADGACRLLPVSCACDDGNPCTVGDTCSEGVCISGETGSSSEGCCTTDAECAGEGPCVIGLCHPTQGRCVSIPVADCCDTDVACDDGNSCTTDTCALDTGECVIENNSAACDDGDACTSADQCIGGACGAGLLVDCDDGNPCTTELCDPQTGCAYETVTDGAPCDDQGECQSGVCESNPVCCEIDGKYLADAVKATCLADGGTVVDDALCEPPDPCEGDPCALGGTCVATEDGGTICACEEDADCTQAAPHCRPFSFDSDVPTKLCVECVVDQHCAAPTPVCASGVLSVLPKCIGCFTDSQCDSFLCSSDYQCIPCTANLATCNGGRVCNELTGVCIEPMGGGEENV